MIIYNTGTSRSRAEYRQAVKTDIDCRCNNCTDVYQPDNFGPLPAEYHDQIHSQAEQPMQLVLYSDSDMSISSDESPTSHAGPASTDSTPVRQQIVSPVSSPSSLHIPAFPQPSPDIQPRQPSPDDLSVDRSFSVAVILIQTITSYGKDQDRGQSTTQTPMMIQTSPLTSATYLFKYLTISRKTFSPTSQSTTH